MNDKGIDTLINIIQQISVEPSVLLLSSEATTKSGQAFYRLPWSCVYTTQRSERIESAFIIPLRRVVGIISSNDSSVIRLNNREMPFVRLLGIEPEASDPIEQLITTQVFLETIPRLLQPYGRIVIDYDDAHPEVMQQLCIQLNKLSRKKTAYLFGIKDLIGNAFIQRLVEKGVAIVFEESLWDSLEILDSTEYEWDESTSAESGSSEGPTIFVRKKSHKLGSPLDRELLLNIDSFASLLNYEDVEISGSFPVSETMQRFQTFLQSSTVGKPQWYGYRENSSFHLKRYFEEDLYQNTIKALESADSKERRRKPIMLRGQACCGKTNALCALAYRVFHDGIYPVIYIPDSDVDFSNVYETNDDGIVEIKKHDAFLSLEALLRQIEGKSENPVPTLIVWDTSCRLHNEIKNGFDLLSNLRSAGRQVQIICTSHGIIHSSNSNQNPYDYYDTIDIDPFLKGPRNQCCPEHPECNEVEQVQKMLIDFAGFQPEDASRMMRYYSASDTFIGSLYLFRELHRDLKKRLRGENEGRIKDIVEEIETLTREEAMARSRERVESVMAIKLRKEMARVGWQLTNDDSGESDVNVEEQYENHCGKIENLVCCIAFCTIYKEKLSMAMAVRLLGTIDVASSKIFGLVMNNSLLRSEMSMDGEPVVSIRSELEAKLLLDEYGVSRMEILNQLIAVMSSQEGSADVRLIQSLIQITGPNNVNSELSLWNANFDGFEKLICVLKQFREETNSDVLLLQELTLTRELCSHRQWPYDNDKKLALLRDAKTLAEAAIDIVFVQTMTSFSANLFVEWANICLRVSQKDMSVSKTGLYRDISMKMELVIRRYPKNGYAYSAYLWAGIDWAKELADSDEKLMLIQRLCNIADTILDESSDTGLDTNAVGEIDNLMDNMSISEDRFKQSIREGKSYGLYFRIRKIIGSGDNRLDFTQPLGKEAASWEKCKRIAEIANDATYRSIIITDPACMYAVINVKWLLYSKQPIIPSQENVCIGMSQDNWTSIHADCKLYLDTLCRFRSPRIVYLQALSAAHITAYRSECKDLFDELWRGTNFEKRSLHVLCDEDGNPLLFDGQLSGKYNTYKNRGYINATGFSNAIYFRAERVGRNGNSIRENERFHNLSIAVSYSGFQVCKL